MKDSQKFILEMLSLVLRNTIDGFVNRYEDMRSAFRFPLIKFRAYLCNVWDFEGWRVKYIHNVVFCNDLNDGMCNVYDPLKIKTNAHLTSPSSFRYISNENDESDYHVNIVVIKDFIRAITLSQQRKLKVLRRLSVVV